MSRIIKLKGAEFTAPTGLAAANSAVDSPLVKVYHTAAVTVTVVTSANAAVGNTTLDAGVTDYSQNKQTLTFVCTPTGFRGTGQSAFATYDFINQIRYVATSDGDYEGESREWRLLEE